MPNFIKSPLYQPDPLLFRKRGPQAPIRALTQCYDSNSSVAVLMPEAARSLKLTAALAPQHRAANQFDWQTPFSQEGVVEFLQAEVWPLLSPYVLAEL